MKHSRGEGLKDLLNLVRLPNLLVVALTMMLMRYAVIRPLLGAIQVTLAGDPVVTAAMDFRLGWFDFLILVVSTCFITAAGYVINDYFDIRADLINRGTIIVGNTITRRMAMMYHNVFNILGVIGGTYVSARIGYIWLGIFFVLISGLLYFYSATYKRQFLIGNIIVALLVAAVPMIVVVYDAAPVYAWYSQAALDFPGVAILFWWVGASPCSLSLQHSSVRLSRIWKTVRATGRREENIACYFRAGDMQDNSGFAVRCHNCSALYCVVQVSQ
ncbi:MAG: UbiA family prenyltransferase [Bacteroidales bacterium]